MTYGESKTLINDMLHSGEKWQNLSAGVPKKKFLKFKRQRKKNLHKEFSIILNLGTNFQISHQFTINFLFDLEVLSPKIMSGYDTEMC